ncbi:LCP family protein [Nocardiopsis sp. RSe5-2]|uniref:LCP family protein n=1 Tax=Nocardiopsis endophytica TaxID=3018445 RepID=A0ABT4UC05_9ACTN|nr:LCP family protein [Nocardiopsis endophytica]MDA2814281.1 LCP family protein [Nocardiopsis endophytica]
MVHGRDDDSQRTGVFRRSDSGGYDEIEKMYRPERRSSSGSAGSTRRIPPVRDDDEGRKRKDLPPGRVYDGTGAARRKRRTRERGRRRALRIAGAVLALLIVAPLVFAVGFYIWANGRLVRVEAMPAADGRPEEQPGTTYMVVGSDSRKDLSDDQLQDLRTGRAEGKRTDTIMVVYVPEDGRPSIISVPRDSYVDIPGIGQNKINAAFSEELGGGPSTLIESFEQASGVRIDHYVEIGLGGFVDIVDAVGGVEMCPEEAMEDPKAGLDIEAGCQEMDGATALGYVRTRATARADLDRIQRQREFFSALIAKATDTSTLANPFRSVPLVREGTETFEVDEGDSLMDLGGMAMAMREDPTTTSVPVGSTPTLNVGSVVMWDETASETMFEAMRQGEEIPEDVLRD